MARKVFLMVMIIVSSIILPGCLFLFYPLYSDDTLINDNRLIGKFVDEDGVMLMIEQNPKDPQKYSLRYQDDKTGYFDAHLVELENTLFLNLYPNPRLESTFSYFDTRLDVLSSFHYFPMNSIFKVELTDNSLKLSQLNVETIPDLIASKRVRIKHEINEDFGMLITASTRELQQFVTQYKNQPDFFSDAWTLSKLNDE